MSMLFLKKIENISKKLRFLIIVHLCGIEQLDTLSSCAVENKNIRISGRGRLICGMSDLALRKTLKIEVIMCAVPIVRFVLVIKSGVNEIKCAALQTDTLNERTAAPIKHNRYWKDRQKHTSDVKEKSVMVIFYDKIHEKRHRNTEHDRQDNLNYCFFVIDGTVLPKLFFNVFTCEQDRGMIFFHDGVLQ